MGLRYATLGFLLRSWAPRASKALIWASTTPVPNVTTSVGRTYELAVAYNKQALASLSAVAGASLVVDDLWSVRLVSEQRCSGQQTGPVSPVRDFPTSSACPHLPGRHRPLRRLLHCVRPAAARERPLHAAGAAVPRGARLGRCAQGAGHVVIFGASPAILEPAYVVD